MLYIVPMLKRLSKKAKIGIGVGVALLIAAIVALIILNNKDEAYRTIIVYELVGESKVERGKDNVIMAYEDMRLQSEDKVSTAKESYLQLKLDENKYILLEPNTEIDIKAEGNEKDSKTKIKLNQGSIVNCIEDKLSDKSEYNIETPNSTIAVRGTTYGVKSIEEEGVLNTTIECYEGKVAIRLINPDGSIDEKEVELTAGMSICVQSTKEGTKYLEEKEINYEELGLYVLEFLKHMSGKGKEFSITEKEIEEIIKNHKEHSSIENDSSEDISGENNPEENNPEENISGEESQENDKEDINSEDINNKDDEQGDNMNTDDKTDINDGGSSEDSNSGANDNGNKPDNNGGGNNAGSVNDNDSGINGNDVTPDKDGGANNNGGESDKNNQSNNNGSTDKNNEANNGSVTDNNKDKNDKNEGSNSGKNDGENIDNNKDKQDKEEQNKGDNSGKDKVDKDNNVQDKGEQNKEESNQGENKKPVDKEDTQGKPGEDKSETPAKPDEDKVDTPAKPDSEKVDTQAKPDEEKYYNIKFVYNGKVFATQKVKKGEKAERPSLKPALTGDWDYDFKTVVNKDITVTWKD